MKLYDSSGEWVQLFSKSPSFIKTELFCEMNDSHCFVSIDFWKSKEAFQKFHQSNREKYNRIDKKGDKLTILEERIGETIF